MEGLEIPTNGSCTLPKAHWASSSTISPADSSWYFKGLPDKYRFRISRDRTSRWLQQQPVWVCRVPQSQGCCCCHGMSVWGWKSSSLLTAVVFPHLWQLQDHQAWSQELTAEAAKFSLASPAEESCSSSDLTTLSCCSSMWVSTSCVGQGTETPGWSTHLSVFAQPWKRRSQDGKEMGEKQARRKSLSSKSFNPPGLQAPKKFKSDLNSHKGNNEYKLPPTCFGYTKQKTQW